MLLIPGMHTCGHNRLTTSFGEHWALGLMREKAEKPSESPGTEQAAEERSLEDFLLKARW